jgi:hypothetical protein
MDSLNLNIPIFKFTPKPRGLTKEEIDKFHLRYSCGTEIKPAIEVSTVIWSAAMTEKDPIYRLYNKGTNNLLILRYNWDNDCWDRIEYTEIDNLYGLLWLTCLRLSGQNIVNDQYSKDQNLLGLYY